MTKAITTRVALTILATYIPEPTTNPMAAVVTP